MTISIQSQKRNPFSVFKEIENKRRERAEWRGVATEGRVAQRLAALQKKGEIVRWWQAEHLSVADRRGIDFFVEFSNGVQILFQVKSSELGAEKHRVRYPTIPVIVVKGSRSSWEIDQEILLLSSS